MPDPRAEAAYQRALAAYRVGAREAARRFSDDALAADPKHEGARALVASLEARRTASAGSRTVLEAQRTALQPVSWSGADCRRRGRGGRRGSGQRLLPALAAGSGVDD